MARTLYKIFAFIAAIGVFANICILVYLWSISAANMQVQYLIVVLSGGLFLVLIPALVTINEHWSMEVENDPSLKEVNGISLDFMIEFTRCCPRVIKYLATVSFLLANIVACSTGLDRSSINTVKLASVQELIFITAVLWSLYSAALIVLCAAVKHPA